MKRLFALLFLLPLVALGQTKELTIEETSLQAAKFRPETYYNVQFSPDSRKFARYDIKNREIVISDAAASGREIKITTDKLGKGGKTFHTVPFQYEWKDASGLYLTDGSSVYLYSLLSESCSDVFSLKEEGENIAFSPDFTAAAYTVENNLFLQNGSEVKQLTDNRTDVISGQTVSRNEYGAANGVIWAKKGDKLLYYTKDGSGISKYPIINTIPQTAEVKEITYPMAGQASERLSLHIYDILSGKTIRLETAGTGEDYLTNSVFDPDGQYVYVAELSRNTKQMKLNKYSAITGELIKTLFEEKNEKYVEPENPVYFLPGRPNEFIWQSQRDGNNHLYHYDSEGRFLGKASAGSTMVTKILGATRDKIFYETTGNDGLDRIIKQTELNKNYRITPVTERSGTWSGTLSHDGKYIVAGFSDIETPYKAYLLQPDKTNPRERERELFSAANPYAEYKTGNVRLGSIMNEGVKLNYRLVLPSNFLPTNRYPVLVYVYGGPHVQQVTNTFRGGFNPYLDWFAEQGYVVFTLDNRGSAFRGFNFETAVHKNFGQKEMSDQMAGIGWLREQSYINQGDISVYGWSFGGFMSANLALTYPETFKKAVAGGAVCDWSRYEVMYTERYMETPEANPEGYKNANLLLRAKDLKTKLLLIHGTADDVVLIQHAEEFIRAAVSGGAQPDYFIYPGHGHGVTGADRLHLNRMIFNYINGD